MMTKPTTVADLNDATANILIALHGEDCLPAADMVASAGWWLASRGLVRVTGGEVELTGDGLELVEALLSDAVAA